MAKRTQNNRLNAIDAQTQSALNGVYTEVGTALERRPDIAFQQQGATSIDSIRYSPDVLGPSMSPGTRNLVRVALEQTGLFIYSKFKPISSQERRLAFRDTVHETPFHYSIATLTSDDQSLSLLNISVGNEASIPVHNRLQHTFLHTIDMASDEDGLIRDSMLTVDQFSARTIPPELSLETGFTTQEEFAYMNMVDSGVFSSKEATDEIISSSSRSQLNSENPLVRAHATDVAESRARTAAAKSLGALTPTPIELQELRAHIATLF